VAARTAAVEGAAAGRRSSLSAPADARPGLLREANARAAGRFALRRAMSCIQDVCVAVNTSAYSVVLQFNATGLPATPVRPPSPDAPMTRCAVVFCNVAVLRCFAAGGAAPSVAAVS
jgi:hypothetical protein